MPNHGCANQAATSIRAIDRPLEGLTTIRISGVLMPDSDFFWNASSTCTLKVSDELTVPLCRAHYREQYRAGKEGDWWSRNGLGPFEIRTQLVQADTRNRGTRVK